MAEILQFLTQHAHKLKAEQGQLHRAETNDYKMQNELYRLPLNKLKAEGGDMQQFCSFYYRRLEDLKPAVKETA